MWLSSPTCDLVVPLLGLGHPVLLIFAQVLTLPASLPSTRLLSWIHWGYDTLTAIPAATLCLTQVHLARPLSPCGIIMHPFVKPLSPMHTHQHLQRLPCYSSSWMILGLYCWARRRRKGVWEDEEIEEQEEYFTWFLIIFLLGTFKEIFFCGNL